MNLEDYENEAPGYRLPTGGFIDALRWNPEGLVPVVAQQYDSGEVLMLAWMNRTALLLTLEEGAVCYWSRSRGKLWRKGESSGQIQRLVELRADCDGDTLLALVDQTGPACHTGRPACFFWRFDGDDVELDREPVIDPEDLYGPATD